jgi:hypothetical protein
MDNKATGLSRKTVNNLEKSETRLLRLCLGMWLGLWDMNSGKSVGIRNTVNTIIM